MFQIKILYYVKILTLKELYFYRQFFWIMEIYLRM